MKTKKKKDFSEYRRYHRFRELIKNGFKKLQRRFVNAELWVGFGAQEIEVRKIPLKS